MRTSHVGSFPLDYSRENVYRVMRDLWEIGLDAPPYPQLRSFIDIYLQPLVDEGIVLARNGFYFINMDRVKDIRRIRPRILEAEDAIEALRKYGLKFKWLRAPVTGVFTLASRLYIEDDIGRGLYATLLSRKDVVRELLAPYVRSFIDYLLGLGYNIVFLDEPILGVIVGKRRIILGYTEDYIADTINYLLKNVYCEKGIHICGRISNKLFELLASIESLDILNFEFYDTRKNLDIIDHRILEKYDKLLAPGIVSAKRPFVEEMKEIRELLSEVYKLASGRIDLVSGDCGFAGLKDALTDPLQSYYIAIKKLETIVNIVHSMMRIT